MADDDIKRPLFKPLDDHGTQRSEITLRRPTVLELRQCGQPYALTSSGGIKADYDACAKLLAAQWQVPPSSIDALDGADFDDLAMMLVGFTKRAAVAATGSGSPPGN